MAVCPCLIFTSIRFFPFPSALGSIQRTHGWGIFAAVSGIGLLVMLAGGLRGAKPVRRIPVQYAKRMIGRRPLVAPALTFR